MKTLFPSALMFCLLLCSCGDNSGEWGLKRAKKDISFPESIDEGDIVTVKSWGGFGDYTSAITVAADPKVIREYKVYCDGNFERHIVEGNGTDQIRFKKESGRSDVSLIEGFLFDGGESLYYFSKDSKRYYIWFSVVSIGQFSVYEVKL